MSRAILCNLIAVAIVTSGWGVITGVTQTPTAAGATKTNPKDGLTYVWIPPGKFTMGCSSDDTACEAGERPAREVTISTGFWLGQTEVTQAAYEKIANQNPSAHKAPTLPVETVSWDEAQAYCKAVGGRLPTEAEWEYAARAGTTTVRHGDLDRIAWHVGNSGGVTHEVASKDANAWGLHDMLGNVWEWAADWYDDKYYASGPATDPAGPMTGQLRALRGGGRNMGPGGYRVSFRGRFGQGRLSFGFRCALQALLLASHH